MRYVFCTYTIRIQIHRNSNAEQSKNRSNKFVLKKCTKLRENVPDEERRLELAVKQEHIEFSAESAEFACQCCTSMKRLYLKSLKLVGSCRPGEGRESTL